RVIRDDSTFYEIKPLPEDLIKDFGDDGGFRHQGKLEVVRSFADVTLERLRAHAAVRLSDAAVKLLDSARKPTGVKLAPFADFAGGNLTVDLELTNPGGTKTPIPLRQANLPVLIEGQFVQVDESGTNLAHRLKALSPSESGGKLSFHGASVPLA